jgi:hypothetical protein
VVFVPELLHVREYERVTPLRHDGTNVSLFAGAHHRKNLFVQLAEFELTRRSLGGSDWTLHLNGQSIADSDVRSFLEALRVPVIDHGFLERPDYLSLLAGMDAGLSVALSESYCYVAADHIALRVPVVTSGAVRCADAGQLRVENPWSLDDVAERLRLALERPGARPRGGCEPFRSGDRERRAGPLRPRSASLTCRGSGLRRVSLGEAEPDDALVRAQEQWRRRHETELPHLVPAAHVPEEVYIRTPVPPLVRVSRIGCYARNPPGARF